MKSPRGAKLIHGDKKARLEQLALQERYERELLALRLAPSFDDQRYVLIAGAFMLNQFQSTPHFREI